MALFLWEGILLRHSDGLLANNVACCCGGGEGCENCPCCTECPSESPQVFFSVTGAVDNAICADCNEGVSGVEMLTDGNCSWRYDMLNGFFCSLSGEVVFEIVQEDGTCFMRATATGDSTSSGGGGLYTVVWEEEIGEGPINCTGTFSLPFKSDTVNVPCDFTASNFVVTILF